MSTTSGHYKRYPGSVRTLFRTESMEAAGELVDVSRDGARISSKFKPSEGEELTVRFTVPDYPEVFEVRGKVVRVQSDSWSMMFLEEPVGWAKLRQVLDERA